MNLGEQYICSKLVQKTTIVRGSFLLSFEQVFVCQIYFNSAYIRPVGMMLFNIFLADVNVDFLYML